MHFQTPEDVDLQFDLAGPVSRIAAGLIDYLILAVVIVSALFALMSGGIIAVRFEDLTSWDAIIQLSAFAMGALLFVVFGLHLGYFVASEWWLSGQSPGKRLLGLRVVRDGGYAVTFGASFLRNVVRMVDMLPGAYLVGVLSVLLSSKHKRLGDFVAGTVVIRHDEAPAPTPRFEEESYAKLSDRKFNLTKAHLSRLDARALQVLDGYFDRVDSMAEDRAAQLTRSIAERLSQRMEFPLEEEADLPRFLKELYLALRESLEAQRI